MQLEEVNSISSSAGGVPRVVEPSFIDQDLYRSAEIARRQARLGDLVLDEIVPRLMRLHSEVIEPINPALGAPSEGEIVGLARIVMTSDIDAAAAYVLALKARGLDMETLFLELLEPAARRLGEMWERDECSFVDVTIGVARLQNLLAIFNSTNTIPALNEKRSVLLVSTPGEQHSFGVAMLDKFLRAGGWTVHVERPKTPADVGAAVASGWFAVAGLSLSSETHLDVMEETIATIRRRSRNRAIGVMVGGSLFNEREGLAAGVGADATAANAPAVVLLAQKLFDIGATTGWRGPRR
jgi:methanogenic corrinoid protein MtbC1